MRAKLNRFLASDNSGIFGELYFDESRFCFTKERLWANNKKCISCIPDGIYLCKQIKSPTFGWTYVVCGVVDRYNILFHWGSYMKNSKGCILVGKSIASQPNSDKEVLLIGTRKQHRRMMKHLKGVDEFTIEVSSPWGLAA